MTEPAFLKNIQDLLTSGGTWIAGLGVPGGGLMIAYHALMRNFNDDPQSTAHHLASMKKVLAGTAIVGAAGALSVFAGKLL